jgi:glycosyltransferase involved in cell wall biosynthesis
MRLALHEKMAHRYFTRNVRHIVSISDYIRNGMAPDTHATLYPVDNPVSDKFFALPPDRSLPGRLLFVGMLRRHKRPDLAVDAFQRARAQQPLLSLHMAGSFYDKSLSTALQNRVQQQDLSQSVHLLGHLDEPSLLEQYREASILLLTSDIETSPMAVLQAMAAGTAVIATRVGGVPYLIEHGQTGLLVNPQDLEGVTDAILQMVRDTSLRKRLAENARKAATERFHSLVVARKMAQVYRQVLAAEGSQRTGQ